MTKPALIAFLFLVGACEPRERNNQGIDDQCTPSHSLLKESEDACDQCIDLAAKISLLPLVERATRERMLLSQLIGVKPDPSRETHQRITEKEARIAEKEEKARQIISRLRVAVPSLNELSTALNEFRVALVRLSRSTKEQELDKKRIDGMIDSVDALVTGVYLALVVLSGHEEASTPDFYNPGILLTLKGIREELSTLELSPSH